MEEIDLASKSEDELLVTGYWYSKITRDLIIDSIVRRRMNNIREETIDFCTKSGNMTIDFLEKEYGKDAGYIRIENMLLDIGIYSPNLGYPRIPTDD